MPGENIKRGLRVGLRLHEIGDASPYQLFFAGKGKSGASFGFMQGDLAAGQKDVTRTFKKALGAAGVGTGAVEAFVKRLSVHLISNPLSAKETKQINDALLGSRKLVDDMDERILESVYADLDRAIAEATSAGREVDPKAQIYMALWINMSGQPTKLLDWLAGRDPYLPHPVAEPGEVVDGPSMEIYLRATSYYSENPGNFPHMLHCAAAGAAAIDHDAVRVARAEAPAELDARALALAVAAEALGGPASAKPRRAAQEETGDGNDVGEFASEPIESPFTTTRRWLDEPPSPRLLDLYFAQARVEDFDFGMFGARIAALGLRHFKPLELLFLGASNTSGTCKGTNSLPPEDLWPNIEKTALMLDRIRERLGAPIHILSAYRAEPYNTCIGGESASLHMRFNAIDWTCDGGTVEQWRDVARQVRREQAAFTGGIGYYPAKRFIHIDTRGSEANW